ncbi:MAG: FAD:protein FMN transferase [Candidatus Coatesbacteria bacterium]|nr:FAD:protein FMN transferase [Candidatus Coatesbacteria bacterium]
MSRIFILLIFLVLCSCSNEKHIKDTFFLMNTVIEVDLEGISESKWEKIKRDFTKNTDKFDWHKKGGKSAEWDSLSIIARNFEKLTQGCFNTRIRPLVKLWTQAREKNDLPSKDAIRLALSNHDEEDFGGIAKGYLTDKLYFDIIKAGVKKGYINSGGHIRVIGNQKPGIEGWEIGIRHPDRKDEIFENIKISSNQAIATSGDYERFFMFNGKRYCHILDPKTGYPPVHSVRSVTVVAEDLTTADALATGLFVAGLEGAKDWFYNLPMKLDVYWIYEKEGKLKSEHWSRN